MWEAHKAVIRRVLIKHGSRIKRQRTGQMVKLLNDLNLAEAWHKHAQTPSLEAEILLLHQKITNLMQFQRKQQYRSVGGSHMNPAANVVNF